MTAPAPREITMLTEVASPLSLFHPLVASWFAGRVGEPTEIQRLAWPEIAAGRHVLVTAPTGSGKTLTAFLWALDRLLTGTWEGGTVRVLYVSPLKALNNDVERNLLAPLAALEAVFAAAGAPAVPVRVATRSGDTPPAERQRTLRRPPEILITTPESLNILLTSKGGRRLLGGLRTVILDEVHAVAGSKRGTHLITAVERLTLLSGEFQRVALSATVRPLERIARFVGGAARDLREPSGCRRRPVEVIVSRAAKRYELAVSFPAAAMAPVPGEEAAGERLAPSPHLWDALAGELRERIRSNRSTLIFANSRRTTEKLTRLINEGEAEPLAYAHHGSLVREIRAVVEERLKEGRLKAIIATSSLELGIDIGSLDEVILVQTPPTAAAAIQRVGRAGHAVGETSRGRLYPLYGWDLLEAALAAQAILGQEIEAVRPIENPLDVLAQVILSMTAAEPWDIEELYRFLGTADPYRHLPRRQFDLVLEMLAGRYADSRVRELRPRISIDRVAGTVQARPGAAQLVFTSGGTIPERGYFALRVHDSMAKIGELDEEFVWERSVGDTFTLGAQSWRIRKITHNDVLVAPARGGSAMAPFWRAEPRERTFFLSERVGRFLEMADRALESPDGAAALAGRLEAEFAMEPAAAGELVGLLERQRSAAGPLPHRRRIVAERTADTAATPRSPQSEGRSARRPFLLHTLWGGRVNRPFSLALAAAWEEREGYPLPIEHDDDCLLLELPEGVEVAALLGLVTPDNVEALLRRRLEGSGFFGARFRENAGRALLLPRGDLKRRVPLWMLRARAKQLFQAVAGYDDFPLLTETWRTCLADEFELEALKGVLAELEGGDIELALVTTTAPSPFAADLLWKRTNRLMYEDDVPEGPARSGLRDDLLRELVFSSPLRPRLPSSLIDRFERKLQRTWPGYAPATSQELLDWVEERVLLPLAEWRALVEAAAREVQARAGDAAGSGSPGGAAGSLLEPLAGRLIGVRLAPGAEAAMVAVAALPRILAALGRRLPEVELSALSAPGDSAAPPDPLASAALARLGALAAPAAPGLVGEAAAGDADRLSSLVAEWLRYYGPLPQERIAAAWGLGDSAVHDLLESLVREERVVVDVFREEPEPGDREPRPLEICDAENLERLLRLHRAAGRAAAAETLAAQPLARLPLVLAVHQGLTAKRDGLEGVEGALEQLFGYPAPAALWEGDLLPARLSPYYPSWLDTLLAETGLVWFGCGPERLSFAFEGDLPLFREEAVGGEREGGEGRSGDRVFPGEGRFRFEELLRATGLPSAELRARLWELAWAGEASNSGFAAVRRGVRGRFQGGPEATAGRRQEETPGRPRRRAAASVRRLDRWRPSRPHPGDWFPLPGPAADEEPDDPLEREERNKERVRILLTRYGILFRELLARELAPLQWGRLFRALRLMELSGEVVAGHFFEGVPGLQFAAPGLVRRLREGIPEDPVYWMNAFDPVSPCGLGLEALRGDVPSRLPTTHLVFHGPRLVVVSRRNAAELEVRVGPDHPRLGDYLGFVGVLLARDFHPLRAVEVETVNGEPAAASPYAAALGELGAATREHRSVRLRRRY